jgi:pimeloyl-ACP methyl ester carboxylesterase
MPFKIFKPFELIFLYRRAQLWSSGLKKKEVQISKDHKISYWDGGKGKPIILVHGLGGSVFQDFAAAPSDLVKKYRVICFDLPGFGISHQYPFEQSIRNHVDFLLRFMDLVGIPQAHLIGNSMGGWISLRFAHQHPERLLKLILVASAGIRFSPPPLEVFTPDSPADVELLFSYLKVNPPKLPHWILKDWLRHSQERRHSVKTMIDSMLTGRDLMDASLQEVSTPTLLLWGEKDRLIPVEAAHRMLNGLPHAKLEVFEKKGHLLFHEAYSEIMLKIQEWLG